MWIQMSKDLFNFDDDVYICNTYVLPPNSPLHNQTDFDFFEQIESDIDFSNKKVKFL